MTSSECSLGSFDNNSFVDDDLDVCDQQDDSVSSSLGTDPEPNTVAGDVVAAEGCADNTDCHDKIRVYLRLRPMNKLEASRRGRNCTEVHECGTGITVNSQLEGEYDFQFDRVFDEKTVQSKVYNDVGHPMAQDLVGGYNSCIFAYGQTGTGKTHTMMGVRGENDVGSSFNNTGKISSIDEAKGNEKSSSNEAEEGGSNRKDEKDDGKGQESTTVEEDEDSKSAAQSSPPERKSSLSHGADDDENNTNDCSDGLEQTNEEEEEVDEKSGIIPRIVHHIFTILKNSPSHIEYTIRCSYVEIYLEKILDLLDPSSSRRLSIVNDNDDNDDEGIGGNINIANASEACCIDESDVVALLVRGNACRAVSSTRQNTNSSRSHALFILKLEQKNEITGGTTSSTLSLVDLAGSEMAANPNTRTSAEGQSLQEAKMIHRSLSALNNVAKTLSCGETRDATPPPYRQSKLTRLLREALGGNCRTRIILTASASSYNVGETLSTIRFGNRARAIKNSPQKNELRPLKHYQRELKISEEKQKELLFLLKRVSSECRDSNPQQACPDDGEQKEEDQEWENFEGGGQEWTQTRNPSSTTRFSNASPLWDSIEQVLREQEIARKEQETTSASKTIIALSSVTSIPDMKDSVPETDGAGTTSPSTSRTAQEEIAHLKRELATSIEVRNQAESTLSETQSEVAVLRTQIEQSNIEKQKQLDVMIAIQNEVQVLTQAKMSLEHKLRISMYRENESTVFLRQFRRFYRRLLKHKAKQGNGTVPEIISKVLGVPDLSDLIDIDTLLAKAGLIEESELHDDNSLSTFRPSQRALQLSSRAASSECLALDDLEKTERELSYFTSKYVDNDPANSDADSLKPTGSCSSTTLAQEKELQKDLREVTEKCMAIQVALVQEKSKLSLLTNRPGILRQKKLIQETLTLKEQLDKKSHDLQAIIWKMNELHLINKTFNEKMTNRDQHVSYLEDHLQELQDKNRSLILEKQSSEAKLRQELDHLKVLVDAMTIPLWQFGECGVSGRSLVNRIVLPVRGQLETVGSADTKSVDSNVVSSFDVKAFEEELELLKCEIATISEARDKRELEIEDERAEIKEELNTALETRNKTEQVVAELHSEVSLLRSQIEESEEELITATEARNKSEQALSGIKSGMAELTCQVEDSEGELFTAMKEKNQAVNSLLELQNEGSVLRVQLHKTREELAIAIKERDEAAKSLSKLEKNRQAGFVEMKVPHTVSTSDHDESFATSGDENAKPVITSIPNSVNAGDIQRNARPDFTGMEILMEESEDFTNQESYARPTVTHNTANRDNDIRADTKHVYEEKKASSIPNFSGGKPASFVPRRFAPKKGLSIRAGITRESKTFSSKIRGRNSSAEF